MKGIGIIGREHTLVAQVMNHLEGILSDVSVISIPTIVTEDVPFDERLFEGADSPGTCVVFTSPRSVTHFTNRYSKPIARAIAIGKATAIKLQGLGISPWFLPTEETSEGLAEELLPLLRDHDRTVECKSRLIQPSSDIAGRYLQDYFSANGYEYHVVATYRTIPNPLLVDALCKLDSSPLFFVFFSPSGVSAWQEALAHVPWRLRNDFVAVSIGPKTTAALKGSGYTKIIEADSPHSNDIAKAILKSSETPEATNCELNKQLPYNTD